MNEIELIDFCEEHFTDYAVCKALKCEELCKDDDCPLVRVFNGYRAALREKQTRESGCDYCLTTWPNHAGWLSDIWHGNQLSVGYGVYREINYCPMCGARVEAEPTGEGGAT